MMGDEKSASELMPPPPPPPVVVNVDIDGDGDGEGKEDEISMIDKLAIEKAEEKKLKEKYAQLNRAPGAGGGGHSAFLQKRLVKGQKFFDSGDYQMAKQKPRGGVVPAGRSNMTIPVLTAPPTGDAIPTPDTVPARKTSIIQPIHDASRSMHVPSDPAHLSVNLTPVPPAPGQPLPNPALAKLAS